MPAVLILERRRFSPPSPPIAIQNRFDRFPPLPRTCTPWRTGCSNAVWTRWLWNPPGCTGYHCFSQWLQYLHSVGLLRASFRPEHAVCEIRALMRYRDNLVQMACVHVQHMQKSLDQMNLQIHHVISDITGVTGLAIVDAIVAGNTNPKELAKLRDHRIKASIETVTKSLVGDYRPEHIFTLKQSLTAYRHYQKLIADCDQEVQQRVEAFQSNDDGPTAAADSSSATSPTAPSFDLHSHLERIFGVDLTAIPGFDVLRIQTIFSELGADMSPDRKSTRL